MITHVTTLVASSGLMRIEQAGPLVYKVMRQGEVDSYIGHITERELRDLVIVARDLLAYIDTAPLDALEAAS